MKFPNGQFECSKKAASNARKAFCCNEFRTESHFLAGKEWENKVSGKPGQRNKRLKD
ncbi:TPA: hypothetical protein ACXYOX_004236 [Escherichia coli]